MHYFHDIDPIAFSLGTWNVPWYALTAVAGVVGAAYFQWQRWRAQRAGAPAASRATEYGFYAIVLAVLLGRVVLQLRQGADPFGWSLGPRVTVGPILVHWYGLMYLGGFIGAWLLGKARLHRGRLGAVTDDQYADLAFYVMLGVILGGRIGYMVFYGTEQLLHDPTSLFRVWEGGMSFHGGLLGVLVAGVVWSRARKIRFWDTVDFVAPLVPIGLGLGRLGNWIGGELWGRHTDAAWGVIFPRALDALNKTRDELYQMYLAGQLETEARHPSQLYEFALEGLVMFTVLVLFSRVPRRRYAVSGLFALMYGCFRFAIEFVREPDAQLGYLAFGWLTMGQVLSLPLIVVGVTLLVLSRRQPVAYPAAA